MSSQQAENKTVRWTPEQLACIASRDQDILLSAAAGSGKTAVLVARILSLIEEGYDIERMLVLTFTRAAAAQMRSRLGAELIRRAGDPSLPLEKRQRLYQQALKLPSAQVSTLHSCCTQILRRHFARVGVDPDFRIADPTEVQVLEAAAMDALMQEEHEKASPVFLRARACYSPRWGDLGLRQMILTLNEFMQSLPHGQQQLAQWIGQVEQGDLSPVLDLAREELAEAIHLIEKAISYCDADPGFEGHAKALGTTCDRLEGILRLEGDALIAALGGKFTFDRFPGKRGLDEGLKATVTAARDAAKKAVGRAMDLFAPTGSAQDMAPVLWELLRLTTDFSARVRQEKDAAGVLGYSDLELLTLAALEAGAGEDVRAEFDLVFVDEYQDISRVQEAILTLVSPPGGRFDVGDVKQSIYRFRLAAPDLFLGKYHAFPDDENTPQRRIHLNHNFRSRPCILQAVNGLFSRLMDRRYGELDYGEREALHAGLGDDLPPGGGVELCLIEDHGGEDPFGQLKRARMQAQAIAARISALISTPWYDPKDARYKTLDAGDIAVLMRTHGARRHVMEALDAAGIPTASGQGSAADSPERETALSLLKLVDNPRQDVPLLAALTTTVGGFTLEELTHLRKQYPAAHFYESAMAAQSDLETALPLNMRMQAFYHRLDHWRQAARMEPVGALVSRVLSESGLYDDVGLLPGGAVRQQLLDALVDEAEAYSRDRGGTLSAFLQAAELGAPGEESAPAGDGVQIMSIHQSKGLEFPVVFVMGIESAFNMQDSREDILLHRALGFGPAAIDPLQRTWRDTPQRRAIAQQGRREATAEEMRLLYVAMTRARDRLILMGAFADVGKVLASAAERLPESWSMALGNSFAKWILPLAIRHPNAAKLREDYGLNALSVIQDPAPWEFTVLLGEDIPRPARVAGGMGNEPEADPAPPWQTSFETTLPPPSAEDTPDTAWVAQRLNFVYPHLAATLTPAKLTVSTLVREAEIQKRTEESPSLYPPPQPRFLSEATQLSAAERGTAVHAAMKHLDYQKSTPEEVRLQIQTLKTRGILSPDEAAVVPIEALSLFLRSPLGQQMAQANLQREVPFTLAIPVREAGYAGCDEEETMLLQGIIDAYFEVDGAITLVDFKTDRVAPQDAAQAAERHRIQLNWYARALEALLKKPVRHAYVVFLTAGVAVDLRRDV